MTMLQSRRLLKPLLQEDTLKPEFSIILGNLKDNWSIEEVLPTIRKTEFDNIESLEKYLGDKRIKSLIPPIVVPARYNYNSPDKVLRLVFDLLGIDVPFNTFIIAMQLYGKVYLFDVKTIDIDKLLESDGIDFSYHI